MDIIRRMTAMDK